MLKGLWELPTMEPTGEQVQVFSHFRLEMSVVRATRAAARFVDPKTVPLATATRKVLARCGLL